MVLRSAKTCYAIMSIFVILLFSLSFSLRDILRNAFLYNIQINSVIILCIFIGIITIYKRVHLFNKEYSKLMQYNKLHDFELKKLILFKPITLYISKNNKTISQAKHQTILSSVEKRLDDYASFPRYISGILIFLGLLGTFWGLSHTISNVANIINNLGIVEGSAADAFGQLKDSLRIPLAGMGVAFGCSLFAIAGSLIVGFLLTNQRKVSDDLLNKVEEWLSTHTISFDVIDNMQEYHGAVFSMGLLEKTIETIYAFQNHLKDLDENRTSIMTLQKDIAVKISKLSDALVVHQDVIKTLGKNQLDLHDITMNISPLNMNTAWLTMVEKITSIDKTLSELTQDTTNGRIYIVDTLGKDIRMISKTLSALIRE